MRSRRYRLCRRGWRLFAAAAVRDRSQVRCRLNPRCAFALLRYWRHSLRRARDVMNIRVLLCFALSMPLLLLTVLARAAPNPEVAAHMPELIIYSAKGAPNSCGPGCEPWMAIKGKVDARAPPRAPPFSHHHKRTPRP